MKKYFSIFKYSLKVNFAFVFDYFFSTISFAVHMMVFGFLWDYILRDGTLYGYSKTELIWYIVMAEFITYGVTSFYKNISEMVKDGTIANMLVRPINMMVYFLCEQSANIMKIVINLIAALIIGNVMTMGDAGGGVEITLASIGFFALSSALSFIIAAFLQLVIGFIAFFMEEVKAIWLIVQKVQLLIVFIPIEFYDTWVQKLLWLSPTTHMIYAPGRIFVKYNMAEAINLIGLQIVAVVATAIVAMLLYRKGVEKINVNGG